MLKDNLAMLRKINGYSQEEISEKIGISRQAYAKWESGATIPDVEKCSLLAKVYGTTVDGLLKTESVEGVGLIPPAPEGKYLWGAVTINDRGQIVIPKEARDKFGLSGGQRLIVCSNEQGIALIQAEVFEKGLQSIMEYLSSQKK